MELSNRFFVSFLLILSSFILGYTNGFIEIVSAIATSVSAYLLLYKWCLNRTGDSKHLPVIFSISYLLSYLFILWINNISINLGTNTSPFLPGDGLRYLEIGSELALTDKSLTEVSLNYVGYPLVLSWIFKLFGTELIFGLLTNMILLFVNILLVSESTVMITNTENDFKTSFVLLLLTSGFMATGFMLLKDGFIISSISLSLYGSLKLLKSEKIKSSYILLVISVLLMALFRFTFVWVPVLIFFTVTFRKSKSFKLLPVMIVLLGLGISLGNKLALGETSVAESLEFATSNTVISDRLQEGSASFISSLISGYDNWSIYKKIVFLPITVGIQYITPFDVYNFEYFLKYPFYFISKNYNIFWLCFIGPLLLFSISRLVINRKFQNPLLLKVTYLGALLYVVPAFIFGGAIPRYAVPFFPLLLPVMATNLNLIKSEKIIRTSWLKFLILFCIGFGVMLVVYLLFKGL